MIITPGTGIEYLCKRTEKRLFKMIFKNRTEAARMLAKRLEKYKGNNAVVLSTSQGTAIGKPLAEQLGLPFFPAGEMEFMFAEEPSLRNHPNTGQNPDGPMLPGRTVIVADDGRTPLDQVTLLSDQLREKTNPVVIASAIIPFDRLEEMRKHADDLVFILSPYEFRAPDDFYED